MYSYAKLIIILTICNVVPAQLSSLAKISDDLYRKASGLFRNYLELYQLEGSNVDKKFMPEIANGHIGYQMKNKWIFVNGLYNGHTVTSHRASLPTTLDWRIQANDKIFNSTFILDTLIGLTKEIFIYSAYNLTVTTYAMRDIRQIFVRNISIETSGVNSSVTLSTFGTNFNFVSPDIDFKVNDTGNFIIAKGLTKVVENNYTKQIPVFLITEKIPKEIKLSSSNPWRAFITSVDLDEKGALISFDCAIRRKHRLLHQHSEAWIDTWTEGMIQITQADTMLKQSVHAAQYYIYSSLPFKEWSKSEPSWTFYGLSPGGLAHGDSDNDYMGHVFWDMDTWMYPSVLPFQRNSAIELVKYRLRMLQSAIKISQNGGLRGARYPWESARTGFETSPSIETGAREIHVSADISFAVQQLLWIESKSSLDLYNKFGKTIIHEVARFWASRVFYNVDKQKYEIIDVMPPDEYVDHCNNSAFTNTAARVSLEAPAILAKRYKSQITEEMLQWLYLGKQLTYPVDELRKIILEYDAYKIGQTIKQADVMLLYYPLQKDIPVDYLLNSQNYYDQVTDIHGPAMTWAIYSINWFHLKNGSRAENLFKKNFGNINLPFYVWSESINGEGAVNFHTGMGGFLQNIVNGFMGMRLEQVDNGKMIFNPSHSGLIQGIVLHNIKFQDSEFNIEFDNHNISVKLLNDGPLNVFATLHSVTYTLNSLTTYLTLQNQEIIITSVE